MLCGSGDRRQSGWVYHNVRLPFLDKIMHNNKKSITLPKELEPFCNTVTSVDADQKKIQLPYLSRGEKQW
jgi:hypothetical protein